MKTLSFVIILLLSAISFAQMGGQSGLTGGGRLSPNVYSGNVTLYDDVQLICGSSADAAIEWDTAQTNDHLAIGVSGSRRVYITEVADMSVDFGKADSTNPEVCVHSADAVDVNDYFCMGHNQTNTVFTTGTGGFDIQGTISNAGAGNGGAIQFADQLRGYNSGVAHGVTTELPTDIPYAINPLATGIGGLIIKSIIENANGYESMYFSAFIGQNALTGGYSAFKFDASKTSGTSGVTLADTEEIITFATNATDKVTILGSGLVTTLKGYLPVTVTNVTPAAPYACAVAFSGVMIHVDDSNDVAESYMCFCGVDADDVTYGWFKVQNPAVNCF